jgi:hypothetical protein
MPLAADAVPVPELHEKALGITCRREALGLVVGGAGKCLGKLRRYAAGAGAFQSIGSRGSPGSTMVNLPVTSRGIDGVSSWGTAERFEFVRNLGWKADRLGWDAMALFGCAPKPKRPLDCSGSAVSCGQSTAGVRPWRL